MQIKTNKCKFYLTMGVMTPNVCALTLMTTASDKKFVGVPLEAPLQRKLERLRKKENRSRADMLRQLIRRAK
jgi:hypothetical protein